MRRCIRGSVRTRESNPTMSHSKVCRMTIVLLLPILCGCRSTPPAPPPPAKTASTPPLFLDDGAANEEVFLGKTMAELRQMLRDAIDTPITLSFRSANLQAVVREISQKTGLGIAVTADISVAAEGRPIDLDVRHMPARHVLDWLTRLLGAYYAVEGPQTVFITRDTEWASQDRLKLRGYSVGVLIRIERPRRNPYDVSEDKEQLLVVLRGCLRHTMAGHRDAKILIDETGSRLTAMLPPRGHQKLEKILEELRKPREYVPPETDTATDAGNAADKLLETTVLCNFARQDVRRIIDELGRRANVNIGFDYRRIPEDRRDIALALGETTLGRALEAVARSADLGQVIVEPGRRVWILAAGEDPRAVLAGSGELPWDRAVVRSYYIKPLVDNFGFRLLEEQIRKTVTPNDWGRDVPVGYYHAPTGRLVVLHDAEAQAAIARLIDAAMKRLAPDRGAGKKNNE